MTEEERKAIVGDGFLTAAEVGFRDGAWPQAQFPIQ
jgi:hypothetical protein